MNDSLIILLSDIFFAQQKKGNDPFLIIKFSVPCKALYQLYERLVLIDVPPIESLPVEQKTKYWDIAKKYYETETQAVIASKAVYIIELVTSN